MKKTLCKNLWYVGALAVAPSSLLALTPPPVSVPDAGSTALLATISVFGLCAVRRFLAKR